MVEAEPEQASLVLHSLPSESDCYSEGSAAMDMCVKAEPDDEDISNPSYCTEVKGFSDEELDSALLLDGGHIKQETIMVKIKEDSGDLQLCTATEVLCFPSEQLNSDTCLLSEQHKSNTDDMKTEQFFPVQEPYFIKNEVTVTDHCGIKEECVDLQVNELSFVHCTSTKSFKSDIDEVKVEQFSQLKFSCSREIEGNQSPCDLLQQNLVDPENSLVVTCNDVPGHSSLKQSVQPVTSDVIHTASKESCHDGVTHTTQTWQCIQCRQIFKSQSHLEMHLHTLCGDKCPVRYVKTFSESCPLKQHQLVPSGERKYQCGQCGKSFSQRCSLKRHQLLHSGEKPYKCTDCGMCFCRVDDIKKHQRVHSGETPFKCSQCGKSFSQGGYLKQHQLVHSCEKPYKCSLCGKQFSLQGNLKQHQRIHSGEKPYECSQCGKSFSLQGNLKRHQLVHSDEKPYKCSDCGKGFSQSYTLKQHQLDHSGEKPYECSQCGKRFSQGYTLKQHQLIHSGWKPFKCSQCGKHFSQARNLQRHQFVHFGEKPYKCIECGKSFSSAHNLKHHLHIHSGEKPYKCVECGKSFSQPCNLKRHRRVHSGERLY